MNLSSLFMVFNDAYFHQFYQIIQKVKNETGLIVAYGNNLEIHELARSSSVS